VALPAQSTRVQDLGIGKVLVTQRDSRDPTFAEKVILLVHYDHDGTVGLAINRPTNVAISAALEDFEGTKGRTDPVFVGGPVDVKSVLALLQASATPQGGDSRDRQGAPGFDKSASRKNVRGAARARGFASLPRILRLGARAIGK